MVNYLLTKGYKYYVRLSGNGIPVLGSMIARKNSPRRSGGTWVDVTPCLEGCCKVQLTVTTNTLLLDEEFSGNIFSLVGATSSAGDTLTAVVIDQVIDGQAVAVNADGSFTITPDGNPADITFIVTISDEHGNKVYVSVNFITMGA